MTGSAADLTRWTPIAVQVESAFGRRWVSLKDAPMTLRQANDAHRAGRLLKALHQEGDALYVVVKLARMRPDPAAG